MAAGRERILAPGPVAQGRAVVKVYAADSMRGEAPATKTPEFIRWFGSSKVVDQFHDLDGGAIERGESYLGAGRRLPAVLDTGKTVVGDLIPVTSWGSSLANLLVRQQRMPFATRCWRTVIMPASFAAPGQILWMSTNFGPTSFLRPRRWPTRKRLR